MRVGVSGIGCVAPIGVGREAFAEGLRAGRSGVGRISLFEPNGGRPTYAAECRDFDAAAAAGRFGLDLEAVSRVVPLSLEAAAEALDDAGLAEAPEAERAATGVVLGTGGGALDFAERQFGHWYAGERRKASVYAIPSSTPGTLASEVSIAFGLRGPAWVVSTGCTSSTDAIGIARDALRAGRARRFLVGGADAPVTPAILAGFALMRVVSTRWEAEPARASRPFDADRDGFVLGEGAWFLVLEAVEDARARGARLYGEVAGYAATCDAHHRVRIPDDPRESARAIRLALADAGLPPEAIGYANLHGTGTRMNDPLETRAVREALGAHADRIAASSTKSQIGHPQGACGAAGVAATLLGLRDGFLPPTINLETPDPACDLDYVPHAARAGSWDAALSNCIGFGSKNAALVIRSAP